MTTVLWEHDSHTGWITPPRGRHRWNGAIGRNDYAVVWVRDELAFVRVYVAPDGEEEGSMLWGIQPLSSSPLLPVS